MWMLFYNLHVAACMLRVTCFVWIPEMSAWKQRALRTVSVEQRSFYRHYIFAEIITNVVTQYLLHYLKINA